MNSVSKTARELAALFAAELIGEPERRVSRLSSIAAACPDSIIFAENQAQLQAALDSAAEVIVAGEFAQGATEQKTILIHRYPKLLFARIATALYPTYTAGGIHRTAIIDPSATVGAGVQVGPGAAISGMAVIGPRTVLGAHTFVGEGVDIGSDCIVGPHVTIYPRTSVGSRVRIQAGAVLGSAGFGYVRDPETGEYLQFPQIGDLRIEDDVEIGANSTIDRGALDATVIGKGTKIDNLVHIGHNVIVGKNAIIAAQTGISGSTVIEDGVIIGGQVGIGDHATIRSGVMIGSKAGILPGKIVRASGEVLWGIPARPLRQYLRELGAMARLAKLRHPPAKNGEHKEERDENNQKEVAGLAMDHSGDRSGDCSGEDPS